MQQCMPLTLDWMSNTPTLSSCWSPLSKNPKQSEQWLSPFHSPKNTDFLMFRTHNEVKSNPAGIGGGLKSNIALITGGSSIGSMRGDFAMHHPADKESPCALIPEFWTEFKFAVVSTPAAVLFFFTKAKLFLIPGVILLKSPVFAAA